MYSSVNKLNRREADKKTGAKALFYSPSQNDTYTSKKTKDCIYFASTLEYLVYKELVKLAGVERVKTQVPLLIKKPTERYPAKFWRCDLRVFNANGDHLNIECKGEITREFKILLPFLEAESPKEYDKLIVVANHKPWRINNLLSTCTWAELYQFLQDAGFACSDMSV